MAGRKRLRNVARTCAGHGQRVQFSVFECEVDPAQWVALKSRLARLIDPLSDSLRFYLLGANGGRRIECLGRLKAPDAHDLFLLDDDR